jgi:hypothetical protein
MLTFHNKNVLGFRRPSVNVVVKTVRYKPVAHKVATQAMSGMDFNTISYFTGKSIILFTLFYCSLNWLHYRDLRKRFDDDENDENKKK